MKITMPRSTLREALQGLGRVVPTRATLAVLKCVRIDAGEGGITATGTDLDQILTCRMAGETARPGTCVLDMERLKPFAKGSEEDILTLEAAGDHATLTNPVHGQSIQHNIPATDPAEWPGTVPDVDVAPAPDQFLTKFRAILPFASQDSSRVTLNGVYLERSENGCRLVATDGRRLTCYEVGDLPTAESCIVPPGKFLAWNRLPEPASIGLLIGKVRWFKLAAGPWSYRVRTTEGVYPNWRHVVPDAGAKVSFTIADGEVEILRKALPTFPGHEQGSLRIDGRDGRLWMSGRNTDDKKPTTLDLPASKHEGEVRVSVNRGFLLDALVAGFRQFRVSEHEGPLVALDGHGGTHVLMPMRLTTEDVPPPHPEPAAAVTDPTTPKKEPTMPEKRSEPSALDRLIAAYEAAKAKIREANEALSEVPGAIREALREDKQRRAEIDTVRAGLAKLQAIRV